MSEEQYNHMDQRFREAADKIEQPFDDAAWRRMEKLLDQEDEHRRPFLWWWTSLGILLILGGGFFWYSSQVSSSNTKHKQAHQAIGKKQDQPVTSTLINGQPGHSVLPNKEQGSIVLQTDPGSVSTNEKEPANQFAGFSHGKISHQHTSDLTFSATNGKRKLPGSDDKAQSVKQTGRSKRRPVTQAIRQSMLVEDPASDQSNSDPVLAVANDPKVQASYIAKSAGQIKAMPADQEVQSVTSQQDSARNDLLRETDKIKDPALQITNTSPSAKKDEQQRKEKRSGFYFLAGLGADVSSTRLLTFSNSPVMPRVGIGAGYRINRRWSVQTGFYASAKKYVATPSDYKLSSDPYWNQVTLVGVKARCLVFEIPLQARYDVIQKEGWSLFATTGLSSYLMKKESYDYSVVRYNTSYNYKESYTGNRHPFSVLGFSAGWQKEFNSKISLTLEPYIQVPLAGVGEGKVKLYSFGIQSGILFNPKGKNKPKK